MGHHVGMRKLGAFSLWILATLGSTALAWQAVDAVGVAASGDLKATVVATVAPRDPTETLSGTSPRPTAATTPTSLMSGQSGSTGPSDAATNPSTTTTGSTADVGVGQSQSSGSGGTPSASPTSAASPTDSQQPTTTFTIPAAVPPTTSSTTSIRPTSTTTTSPVPQTTTQSPTVTQTFFLTGGTVTVEYSDVAVVVVVAEPATGFSADVRQKSPTEIDVRFEKPGHRSRLRAWWLAGPRSEIQD